MQLTDVGDVGSRPLRLRGIEHLDVLALLVKRAIVLDARVAAHNSTTFAHLLFLIQAGLLGVEHNVPMRAALAHLVRLRNLVDFFLHVSEVLLMVDHQR